MKVLETLSLKESQVETVNPVSANENRKRRSRIGFCLDFMEIGEERCAILTGLRDTELVEMTCESLISRQSGE